MIVPRLAGAAARARAVRARRRAALTISSRPRRPRRSPRPSRNSILPRSIPSRGPTLPTATFSAMSGTPGCAANATARSVRARRPTAWTADSSSAPSRAGPGPSTRCANRSRSGKSYGRYADLRLSQPRPAQHRRDCPLPRRRAPARGRRARKPNATARPAEPAAASNACSPPQHAAPEHSRPQREPSGTAVRLKKSLAEKVPCFAKYSGTLGGLRCCLGGLRRGRRGSSGTPGGRSRRRRHRRSP